MDDVEQSVHTSAKGDPDVRGAVDLGARHGPVAHDDEVLGGLAGVGRSTSVSKIRANSSVIVAPYQARCSSTARWIGSSGSGNSAAALRKAQPRKPGAARLSATESPMARSASVGVAAPSMSACTPSRVWASTRAGRPRRGRPSTGSGGRRSPASSGPRRGSARHRPRGCPRRRRAHWRRTATAHEPASGRRLPRWRPCPTLAERTIGLASRPRGVDAGERIERTVFLLRAWVGPRRTRGTVMTTATTPVPVAPGDPSTLRRLHLARFGFAVVWALLLVAVGSTPQPADRGPARALPARRRGCGRGRRTLVASRGAGDPERRGAAGHHDHQCPRRDRAGRRPLLGRPGRVCASGACGPSSPASCSSSSRSDVDPWADRGR